MAAFHTTAYHNGWILFRKGMRYRPQWPTEPCPNQTSAAGAAANYSQNGLSLTYDQIENYGQMFVEVFFKKIYACVFCGMLSY